MAEKWEKVAVVRTEEVPSSLQNLIPVAEYWGIKHNQTRNEIIDTVATEDLREFVHALEPRCSDIDRWLRELPNDMTAWPAAAETFLWLRKTWHEAACELYARESEDQV